MLAPNPRNRLHDQHPPTTRFESKRVACNSHTSGGQFCTPNNINGWPVLDTLYLLPASQTRDKDALTEEGVAQVIAELRQRFDWVICDSPAGIEHGATLAMRFAEDAVVVTNPEVSLVRDSDRMICLIDSKTMKAERGERMTKHATD